MFGYLWLICGCYFVYRWLRRRQVNKIIDRFSGPSSYPIIGNALDLLGFSFSTPEKMKNTILRYSSPTRFWLMSLAILFVYDPESIETILSTVTTKGWIFGFFKKAWGDGVATTNNYDEWKSRRRLLNSVFDFNVTGKTYLKIYQAAEQELIRDLDVFVDHEQPFDLFQLVHHRETRKTFHAITGWDAKFAENKYQFELTDLVQSIRSAEKRALRRVFMPWLYPEVIYNIYTQLTGADSSLQRSREILHKIVEDRRLEMKNGHGTRSSSKDSPAQTLLGVLLEPEASAEYDDRARVDEIITYLQAGSVTTSAQVCWILLMFAMHQEHQDRVYDEIKRELGDRAEVTGIREFDKLIFMEQCVKETLRLFPPGCFIFRVNGKDVSLNDGRVIPANTLIILSTLCLHRNEDIYPNPEAWQPNRFRPEELVNRHPCSFAPFTAGPRMCPGHQYAHLSIKSQLVTLLRKYRFTTELRMSDIKLTTDPVLKTTTGYPVRIHRRDSPPIL